MVYYFISDAVYIYIYRERERERKRDIDIDIYCNVGIDCTMKRIYQQSTQKKEVKVWWTTDAILKQWLESFMPTNRSGLKRIYCKILLQSYNGWYAIKPN